MSTMLPYNPYHKPMNNFLSVSQAAGMQTSQTISQAVYTGNTSSAPPSHSLNEDKVSEYENYSLDKILQALRCHCYERGAVLETEMTEAVARVIEKLVAKEHTSDLSILRSKLKTIQTENDDPMYFSGFSEALDKVEELLKSNE